jgi:hypothetical protein
VKYINKKARTVFFLKIKPYCSYEFTNGTMKIFEFIFGKSDWKTKAITRSSSIKSLKKRVAELESSRDKWKDKAMLRQEKILEIEKQKREIEIALKKS